MLSVAIWVLTAMLLPSTAVSQDSDYTIEQLLKTCMEADNDARWGAAAELECEQYISGFTDAYLLYGAFETDNICLPPPGNRADEVRWVFTRWASQNFDRRRESAA